MSKGSTQRPTDKQKFDEGHERIFGKKEKKVAQWVQIDENRFLVPAAPPPKHFWVLEEKKK